MSAENQAVEVEAPKGKMHALRGKYGKDANCGDDVAAALKGADLDALTAFAASKGLDVEKYAGLNNGQRRMNIGNRLRNLVKKGEISVEELEAVERAPEKPAKAPKVEAAEA